jgi:hypothetical protein
MAYRFRKSVKLIPGVRVNFGLHGGSVTVRPRGSSINIGKNGVYSNVGIPGTGISKRSKIIGNSTQDANYSNSPSRQSANPNLVQMKVQLSLQDDGSVQFKDENGDIIDDYYVAQAKRQAKQVFYNWLEENCAEINQKTNDIINIHLSSPSPDSVITFTQTPYPETPPIEPSSVFPDVMPVPPIPKPYGFLAKKITFFRKQVDKKNTKMQLEFQRIKTAWEEKKKAFEIDYSNKMIEYHHILDEYKLVLAKFNEEQEKRRKFIEEDRLKDPQAMQEFLTETFQNIEWPRETNVSFEVSKDGKNVILDVDLPEIEDLPDKQAVVSRRDFRLLYKDISETNKRKNYFTHIHAIGFRIIGEVFVALPTVEQVTLSGYSQRLDSKTGRNTDEYLYSIKVAREKWESIDFSNLQLIDVAECFCLFKLVRNAAKTGVMTPIEPFIN